MYSLACNVTTTDVAGVCRCLRQHLEEAATTCLSALPGVGFRDVCVYVADYEGYAGEVRSE